MEALPYVCMLQYFKSIDKSDLMTPTRSQMFDKKLVAPVATKQPKVLSIHGDDRVDPYYWLNNREDPEVINYLRQENQYQKEMMDHLAGFQEKLYEEIIGRIKQTDMSVPFKYNGYYYITRFEDGTEYPFHTRRKDTLESAEEMMLDVNQLAEGHDFYALGGRSISPDNKLLIFGEDVLSRRIYTLKIKNLETGEMLVDEIPNTSGGATWAADNQSFFYATKDITLRPNKIWKHILGTSSKDDQLVFEELDDTFRTYVYQTKSRKYIVIGSSSTLTDEYRYIEANTPEAEFTIFQPRTRGLEYGIDHGNDCWYIRTNHDALNFRLMQTPEGDTALVHWKEVIAHRKDVLLEGIDVFKNYLVLSERKKGITRLRIIPNKGSEHYIEFKEEAYVAFTSVNLEFNTEILRFGYQSLTTPNSTYDYHMGSRERALLKQQEVLGGFDPLDYKSDRLMVMGHDGVEIPVSIVSHQNTLLDGSSPCLLYGYGSYGASMDPGFSISRISLLDRGFVFAIAHIRGGEEMGRHWYEEGKLLKKKNTFLDFISCGKFLVDHQYAQHDQLYAMGGSAGGLLIGAIINMAPEMWAGVIAAVPFVDVVTTMLDETIPLTTGEFDEWGNPKDEVYYAYIKTYSPYDNIQEKDYPPMLVTTGLHDSQVQYWEPAKWVARLRAMKTDQHPLLLHTNLEAGHGGASGRFQRFKEIALEYAFLLDLAGRSETA